MEMVAFCDARGGLIDLGVRVRQTYEPYLEGKVVDLREPELDNDPLGPTYMVPAGITFEDGEHGSEVTIDAKQEDYDEGGPSGPFVCRYVEVIGR